ALHRLNEDAGVSEASFARVAEDEAVGVGDCLLTVAVEAHAAEIALMQKTRGLRFDGDCAAEFPIGGDGVRFGAGHAELGHGDAMSHEGVVDTRQTPILSRSAGCN